MAGRGYTSHPLLNRIYLAKSVNAVLGGPFVTPWTVYELDNVTLDTIGAVMAELPEMQRGLDKVKSITDAFKAAHPTYRKH